MGGLFCYVVRCNRTLYVLADGIANYVDYSSGIKNYYVYDWCFVIENQTLCGLFYLPQLIYKIQHVKHPQTQASSLLKPNVNKKGGGTYQG